MLVAAVLLGSGCASTVQKSEESAPVSVGPASGRTVVLDLTGSATSTGSKDWGDFKDLWREPCAHEAALAGDSFVMQDREPVPMGAEGTHVTVDVADYRYVSTGARVMLGVMTGNAYINAHVTFSDLKSGAARSTKTYDTTSSAWGGVFSGMTTKQVTAMCHEIFVDLAK
jgi:hypothetical protein